MARCYWPSLGGTGDGCTEETMWRDCQIHAPSVGGQSRRWCVVAALRPARQVDNLGQLARMGVKYAVTCTSAIASFRRSLRQDVATGGCFPTSESCWAKGWWITTLHAMVATDSLIELGVEFPKKTWAMGCCSLSAQNIAVEKVMLLDSCTMHLLPIVGVCETPIGRNEQVAVLPLRSSIIAALGELERTGTSMESNVQLRLVRCTCRECHTCLTASRELLEGDVLDTGSDWSALWTVVECECGHPWPTYEGKWCSYSRNRQPVMSYNWQACFRGIMAAMHLPSRTSPWHTQCHNPALCGIA